MTTDQIRTCALCEYCSIDLGEEGWGESTPAYPGHIECTKGYDAVGAFEKLGLVGLARLARECPGFRMMVIP